MTARFNPPPNWPRPPEGWVPGSGWRPDPAWGPAPPGWTYWVEEPEPVRISAAAPSDDRSGDGPRVFISYRRSDCQPQANGLYDGLSHRLPSASVFMDIDSIPPGADFERHIRREIEICDLVLVLIGDNWLDASADGSRRRIDAPDDFVRLEIESALASPRVKVLPVLVEGAEMPRAADLPETIRPLARLNAMELDDRRWTADLRRLTTTVEALTQRTGASPVAAPRLSETPSAVPLSAPTPPPVRTPARPPESPARPRTPVAGWIMIALPILTIGFANFVPGIWAAVRRWSERRYRWSMLTFAVVIGVLTYVSFALVGSSSDSSDPIMNVAVPTWLLCIVVATVVAVLNRRSPADLPGAADELRRRRERDQYRTLALRDPNLARSMAIGRPDLSRTYSDGGLLDVNALSAETLAHFAPMPIAEARQVVQHRQRIGRLGSLNDLQSAGLPESTVARLRETAVFL
ncbi:MAG TPA: TIR domain-containing protein [Propionibacteriaceae bacterium]|jgi:hypothetical protein|nr:TIR domain-containing protein [Propionibacteriaceae bacterium]